MENKLNKKTRSVIDRYLEKENTKLSISVIYKDESHILNFNQNDKNARYDVGSISKTITSLLVLYTINDGKLSFYETVDKYLDLKTGNYPTIYQLLSHQCNYNHFTPVEIVVKSLLTKRYSKKNIYENMSEENIIKALEKRRKKKIKHKYGYCDFSYAILAIVLKKVSNKPFKQLMNDFIKDYLKLNDTKCIDSSEKRVDCYLKNKRIKNWYWKDGNPYLSAGGISSTIEDMRKYLKLILYSNDDIIKNSLTLFEDEKVHNVAFLLSKNKRVLWHVGGTGQFRSSLTINPQRKIGVIVLGNSRGVKSGNVHYICKMIYNDIRRNRLFKKEEIT